MHGYHPAGLLTSAHKFYSTPLGNIPVSQGVMDELTRLLHDRTGTELTPVANDGEHSLEIELPFLQRALAGNFELVPIMVRTQAPAVLENLGKALAEVLKNKTALLVASTDLSHFYPEVVARRLDSGMLEAIGIFDPASVLKAEASGKGYACGAPAVAAAMWAARELGADKVQVLHHSTSGDETGDRSQVVGYGAAVMLRSP
jgi:AmmeMemoRadiSam system protein B